MSYSPELFSKQNLKNCMMNKILESLKSVCIYIYIYRLQYINFNPHQWRHLPTNPFQVSLSSMAQHDANAAHVVRRIVQLRPFVKPPVGLVFEVNLWTPNLGNPRKKRLFPGVGVKQHGKIGDLNHQPPQNAQTSYRTLENMHSPAPYLKGQFSFFSKKNVVKETRIWLSLQQIHDSIAYFIIHGSYT